MYKIVLFLYFILFHNQIYAQDYSGRRIDGEGNSSFGAFILGIIVIGGVFFTVLFVASKIGEYSEFMRRKKIKEEKELKEKQKLYERQPYLYTLDNIKRYTDKNNEPEFLGISCGCWGFITAFVLIVVPAIVQTCTRN